MPNVMAAQTNISGDLSESSVIAFLVPRRGLADPAAGVPWSNTVNLGERKTWTQSEFCTWQNSRKSPEKMCMQCTSPGDSQTSCKVCLISVERRWCSKEAKTENRIKFAGMPQTRQQISAASGMKFTVL